MIHLIQLQCNNIAQVNYAKKLYVALSDLEGRGVERIVIEEPPTGSEWAGVWDRVSKATAAL